MGKGPQQTLLSRKHKWITDICADNQLHYLSGKHKSKLQRHTTAHLFQWLLSTRQVITSDEEVVEKKEPSSAAGWNIHWYSQVTIKNSMEVPQKINNRVTPRNSSECLTKKLRSTYLQRYMHPYVHCSITHLSNGTKTRLPLYSKGFFFFFLMRQLFSMEISMSGMFSVWDFTN